MIDVEKYVENGFSGCVFFKAKDNFRFAKPMDMQTWPIK
jgi:hypothetical protein